jgi:hypothetical protein
MRHAGIADAGIGRAMWILCWKHPDYRAASVFANFGEGSARKRMIRRVLISSSSVLSLALDTEVYGADRLRSFALIRNYWSRSSVSR